MINEHPGDRADLIEWAMQEIDRLKAEVARLRAAIQLDVDEARECNGYSRCTSSYSNMRHSISALRHPDPPAGLHTIRSAS